MCKIIPLQRKEDESLTQILIHSPNNHIKGRSRYVYTYVLVSSYPILSYALIHLSED